MSEPQPAGWFAAAAHAVRTLTLQNVLVVFLLLLMAVPVYIIYRALSDDALLDRFLSSYREIPSGTACTIRTVAERGGPERWSISTGFAAGGNEKWTVGVILERQPTEAEISSHCATLLLIVERLPHSVP